MIFQKISFSLIKKKIFRLSNEVQGFIACFLKRIPDSYYEQCRFIIVIPV